jgi:hypothetical protein
MNGDVLVQSVCELTANSLLGLEECLEAPVADVPALLSEPVGET